MQIEKKDASLEKRILMALITDAIVCGRIAPHWKKNLFESKWANLVGAWCISYFEKYGKAIGSHIQARFEQWATKNDTDTATQRLIGLLLDGLSEDYTTAPDHSSDYIVDLAAQHFNRIRTLRLSDSLRNAIESGDDAHAEDLFNAYRRIELGVGAGVDVLRDKAAIESAFATMDEDLVVYPEALGGFFKGAFTRDSFVSFVAVEKKGKSWWLMDLGWRGMEQGRNVAFFQIGDMSQNQMIRRFMIRAAKRPGKPSRQGSPTRFPKTLELPPKSRRAVPSFKTRVFSKPLDWQTAWTACQKIVGTDENIRLKLSCHPNGTASIHTIASILETWERIESWVADIIIIDYADLLTPISVGDPIHQINETWKAMRSLSQSRHCLLVTATQANAAAITAETLGPQHFSGNKLKMAHVTAMCGINQTPAEKKVQTSR